jgi:hypothetical protein
MNEFILIEPDGISAESFDSRTSLALALLDMLLAEGELHMSAASDDDGALVVEVM